MSYELYFPNINERYFISQEVYDTFITQYDNSYTFEITESIHEAEYTDPEEFMMLIRPIYDLSIQDLPIEMIEHICGYMDVEDLRAAIIAGHPYTDCLKMYYDKLYTEMENKALVYDDTLYVIINEYLYHKQFNNDTWFMTWSRKTKSIMVCEDEIFILTSDGHVYNFFDLTEPLDVPSNIKHIHCTEEVLLLDDGINIYRYELFGTRRYYRLFPSSNSYASYNYHSGTGYLLSGTEFKSYWRLGMRFRSQKEMDDVIKFVIFRQRIYLLLNDHSVMEYRTHTTNYLTNIADITTDGKYLYSMDYDGNVYEGKNILPLESKALKISSQFGSLIIITMDGGYYLYSNSRMTRLF